MESHIGRPRLFARDGGVYLLGRNTRTTQPHGRKMELALFKIDPATLGHAGSSSTTPSGPT